MAWKKPKYSKSEVSQKFNLKEIFGKDFSNNPDLRDQIGQAIIDKMVERTESGVDISDKGFKPYSTAYKNSDEFKDFKNSSKVNMTLKGDMLEDVDIVSETTNTLKVGFTDDLETKKAYNHNVGDTLPKRQFFGIRRKDIDEIKKEFSSELKELPSRSMPTQRERRQTIGDLVAEARLLEDFFDGES